MKVYVLENIYGRYDDNETTLHGVFSNLERAKAVAEKLSEVSLEWHSPLGGGWHRADTGRLESWLISRTTLDGDSDSV